MRILLAEDDPMLGDGLRAGLRQLGFQVDWVRDGVAAERELGTGDYAAAVLDIGLPQQDGLHACAHWFAVRTDKFRTSCIAALSCWTLRLDKSVWRVSPWHFQPASSICCTC